MASQHHAAVSSTNMNATGSDPEPIAVVGSGCRFPGGATSPSKLWDLLVNPRDTLVPIPTDRFSTQGFYHNDGQYHGHSNVKDAYLLEGKGVQRKFDAPFFGINPGEASTLDPQIRLLLETVYEALEGSGHTIEGLQGSDTAIYTGLMLEDYERVMIRDEEYMGTYHITGTARSLVSNRVSYFFDWHGPSMTIDTACSSSLIAVHQAVQQLRSGQSRVAIAAGANLFLDPQLFLSASKLGMLSPDGRSRMWDADANGYARGEGIAAVVLKPLNVAEADGDSIECIIRETGTNQDGKTPGLTMPSAKAQEKLMRECYTRAGLDPTNPVDRPQYFEAHGTGTPAGDPIEAEAISSVFFPNSTVSSDDSQPLFVGSIKTVIGHTEGTAGIAGLLKASLALQRGLIPPNLLFNRLNPRIEPFYTNLQVPTSAVIWPSATMHRRASVNSFGFGGSNAHAILDSYPPRTPAPKLERARITFLPFIFSAVSENSLAAYLREFCEYLRDHYESLNLRQIAHTLYSRRSRFPLSATFAASNADDLCAQIEEKLQLAAESSNATGVRRVTLGQGAHKPRILGVFTGQGAQWARQGVELVESSSAARSIIERLQLRLDQLPLSDRPTWSLLDELQKDDTCSRIAEAEFSQPLCTAIQIVQVELLKAAGVELAAVVGHSSGEIAATFAAGFITADDAICIAYYRGVCTQFAQGTSGKEGSMMAVESTLESMQELCDSAQFKGRVCVAASNAPTSQTVSGDKDAVEELKTVLDNDGSFARLLKVTKAYHSHHMNACARSYLDSLAALDIQILPGNDCSWFSSVRDCDPGTRAQTLPDTYWNDNMTRSVLFMQAIESAWASEGPFDGAIEVGPHPALRNPATQTIQRILGRSIPYVGLSKRGANCTETLISSLGNLESRFGSASVDFEALNEFLSGDAETEKVVKGLPSYAWNHDTEYWHESRYAQAMRTRSDPVHPLLGHLTPDSTDQEMRWRHLIRPKEVPWLKGHQLQSQTVFPAAGYVVLALEAAMSMAKDRTVSLIEVLDLDIGRALTFDTDNSCVEAIFSFSDISDCDGLWIEATFKYNAAPAESNGSTSSLDLFASGKVRLLLGEAALDTLPSRRPPRPNTLPVNTDDFYKSLRDLDYHYSHPFDALNGMRRTLGASTGFIENLEASEYLVHPAMLDAAFQTVFLAYAAPHDGSLWTMHIPRRINAVRVNPDVCSSESAVKATLPFDTVLPQGTSTIGGDIDIFSSRDEHAMVQIEGLHCVPFSKATVEDDKDMFSTTKWDVAAPNAEAIAYDGLATTHDWQKAHLLERTAVFYLRQLDRDVPLDHPARHSGAYVRLFKFAAHMLDLASSGELTYWDSAWDADTVATLAEAQGEGADQIDFRLLNTMGSNLADIAKGHKSGIELGMENDLLAQVYEEGLGWPACTNYLARTVKQIVHRYPHMNILEVGAGTGGATKSIHREIGSSFGSYTFTDISSGFFEAARDALSDQGDRTTFKVLDLSKDPTGQGFKEESYDLIVASMVLHATVPLEDTMRNIRRLLKPGGYLVALEGQALEVARLGAVFGCFPDWWTGAGEGRELSPFIDLVGWDELLLATGFSGCDTATPQVESLVKPFTVFVTQAVDDRVSCLRDPLSFESTTVSPTSETREVVLVGGQTLLTSRLATHLKSLLGPYYASVRVIKSLAELQRAQISPSTTLVSLTELDQPLFQKLSPDLWDGLKEGLMTSQRVFWMTSGRRASKPHSNMVLGLLRTLVREQPTLDVQLFDFEDLSKLEPRFVAEAIIRFELALDLKSDEDQVDVLLSSEPEIVVDLSGQAIIPRLVMNQAMNDRYNSSRREIKSKANLDSEIVAVETTNSGFTLSRGSLEEGEGRLLVSKSFLRSIRVAAMGCMYLAIGRDSRTSQPAVALSTTNASCVNPCSGLSVPVHLPVDLEAQFLSAVSRFTLVSIIMKDLAGGDKILVHEANQELAAVLEAEAELLGVDITFTSSNARLTPPGWLHIHPSAPAREIAAAVPKQACVFVNCSPSPAVSNVVDQLRAQLSAYCRVETCDTLFGTDAWTPKGSHIEDIQIRFEKASRKAEAWIQQPENVVFSQATFAAGDLASADDELPMDGIIDWAVDTEVPVSVEPIQSSTSFSDNKTYWLAGLSGGLGLSLCEWMIRHGAKYITLTSRRPNIERVWLEKMTGLGGNVTVLPCDMTDRDAVSQVYETICSTMPPLGGVAQGAMVLQDMSFSDMSLDAFNKVVRPKVDGSIHLNDLVQDVDLDFFVFFSSLSAVTGNVGQGNYSAANLFMSSLAEQRRQSGLAASVINIGPVLGTGYISKEDINIRGIVQLGGYSFISETDFHQLFAEGVCLGKPSSSSSIEITTGVTSVSSQADNLPAWAGNPFMSHFVQNKDLVNTTNDTATTNVPIKAQIAEASTPDEINKIIRMAFIQKISSLYQLDAQKLQDEDLDSLQLDGLGTDSLLAVEIRTWFMKTLQVNVPVLKILNGSSIGDLIQIATEALAPSQQPVMDHSTVTTPMEQPTAPKPEPIRIPTVDEYSPSTKNLKPERPATREPTSGSVTDQDSESQSAPSNAGETEASSPTVTAASKSDHTLSSPAVPFTPLTPITPRKTRKLSFSQEMFWFVSMFEEDKTSMNHTALFRLTGKISYPDFRQAVFSVIQRHESLRTCFSEQNGQALQGVIDFPSINLEHHDIQEEEEATGRFNDLKHHSYDLERGDTLRMHLLALSPTVHFLVVGAHGMVADGQSLQVLLRDLAQHYAKGSPSSRPQQYLDYSEKQRLELASGGFDDDLKFWRTELAHVPPPLPTFRLAKAVSRPMLATFENERVDIRIDVDTKAQVQSVCRQCRVTPFHFYLATFRAFLMRHAATEDFAIGIGDANRDDGLMDSIGSFVNLLPLNFRTRPDDAFRNILKETRQKAYSALTHSKIPFQVLLNQLDLSRSATHTPVFQAFVDYRQGQREKQRWADECQLELLEFQASKLAYDIALDIIDDPDGECVVMLIVRKDLYTHEQAERLARSYELLVKQFCSNSEHDLSGPDLFGDEEVGEALASSSGSNSTTQWPETVLHKFEEVCENYPQADAVSCDGVTITYGELIERARTIAVNLEDAGILPGSRLAVFQESTVDWVASVLAIMRTGASYLPLDLSQPFARLSTIARDCAPSLILTDSITKDTIPSLNLPDVRCMEVTGVTCTREPGPVNATAAGVATYLYTSGSTGKPKGVPLTHDGLRSWFESTAKLFDVKKERIMQQSSSSFDMSLLQLFTAMCSGGCICLVPRRLRGDAQGISEFIHSEGITYTYACPSEYSTWMSYGSSEALVRSQWKTAIAGGEPVADALLGMFASLEKPELRLYNIYGPTEVTFAATAMELIYDPSHSSAAYGDVAAGYPLPHYRVYVVDEQMRVVPRGVQGEVFIGGLGVSDGYVHNKSMTDEKFIEDTITPSPDFLHRTGDLGRWRQDGALQIEGRVSGDTQIKLRGLRIDLREVEHAIMAYAAGSISETIVSVRRLHPGGHEMLVAHVMFASDCDIDEQTRLVQTLPSNLDIPQYMTPSLIVSVEELPMTNSGKIDRRAIAELPLPESAKLQGQEEFDLTETETKLKDLWAAVIEGNVANAHDIGPDTDFFHVGGTSLLLLGLQAQIRETFDIEFPLPEMFDSSTLSAMAGRIEGQEGKQSASPIDWAEETQIPSPLLDVDSLTAIDAAEKQSIVLTGASGYLGKALLESLVQDGDVSEVHCIAIRNSERRNELQQLDKVFAYEGDLSQNRLGLSQKDAEHIFGRATTVLHNGADVSYMKTYESLRRPNLESTKQLAEMCLPRMIPFHFVSTAGACSFAAATGKGEISPASVQQYPPPNNGTVGYASSKWASEVFLEKLNAVHTEWPVWVHRPSNIERKGETNMDLVKNLQHYSRLLGAVPSMQSSMHGQMDSVTLEAVVSEILDSVRTGVARLHSSGVHFHHEIGGVRFTVRDLGKQTDLRDTHSEDDLRRTESTSSEIPVDEWATKAEEAGMHPTLVAFLRTFTEHGSIVFPRLTR